MYCRHFQGVVTRSWFFQKCPYGLHFHATKRRCMQPRQAGCAYPLPMSTTTSTTTKTTATTATPLPISTTVITTESPGLCDCPRPFGIFAHPYHCHLFCLCHGGAARERSCPYGQHFNSHLGLCDDPDRAGCRAIPTTSMKPLLLKCTSGFVDALRTVNISFLTDSAIIQFAITLISGPKPTGGCVCPMKHGVFPHPTECEFFCICYNYNSILKHCPGGRHFSPSKKQCDWPQKAGCAHISTIGTSLYFGASYK